MQLASSQRPHPPPVPPRPSRQVVAEALKRTARPPPCPTRQAPPPPNTRPWRHEDQERIGRTVVYESSGREEEKQPQLQLQPQQQQSNEQKIRSHESNEQKIRSHESNEQKIRSHESNGQKIRSHESQRPLASPRGCNDFISSGCGGNITETTAPSVVEKTETRGGVTRAAAPSERNERRAAENQQQQQRRSSGDQRCDRENSATQLSATDAEIPRCGPDEKAPGGFVEDTESGGGGRAVGGTCFARKNDAVSCEEKKSRIFDKTSSRIFCQEEDAVGINEKLSPPAGSTSEGIAKFEAEDERQQRHADDDRAAGSSSFGKRAEDAKGETTNPATPTKIEKPPVSIAGVNNDSVKAGEVRRANGALIGREEDDEVAARGAAVATISSDDCATVVVVDEPERKIAFSEDKDNIHHQDWLEAGIRYSSTKITLPGDDPVGYNRDGDEDYEDERRGYVKYDISSICERIAMSSLQGLPPLPRSLSGFNLSEGRREAAEPPPPPARSSSKAQKNVKSTQPSSSRPSPPGRQLTTLDTQLAILRKEMFGLRQLDLSLLSQLWSLNESIQEFRQLLQEQEDRAPSPSPSSEEGDDNSYGSHPPPPPRRPAPLLHHHRPPRPPRPLRPPASDDSPSSEEYGAV